MTDCIKILGIRFDHLTEKEALKIFLRRINSPTGEPLFAATPNPEMLIEAMHNPEFGNLLNSTDINIADGIGILWAAAFLYSIKPEYSNIKKIVLGLKTLSYIIFRPAKIKQVLPERLNGSTMMIKICEIIGPSRKIFLLGGAEGIAEIVKTKLENKYSVKICGSYAGSPDTQNDEHLIAMINNSRAEVIFVAYGSPKQEFWINRNLPHLKTIRFAIGIGGTFDFIAGKRRRAPRFMQKVGLEWLFRLIQEPKRIKRIFNATIKFPYIVIKSILN
jgi:N-acetylglucosaminyldiphosphoundecaprenol N-acetyl-beta-D-mannosaminyltransferase